MSQRYDIVHIDFQANARGANAAIESMRQGADKCKQQVKDLKEQLEKGKKANLPTAEIQKLEDSLKAARKEFRQWDSAYNQLIKGMRTLDIAVKAFNDGSLAKMNAAFQKSAYNAAKLQKTRLNPESQTYKKDSIELQALMDAAQRNLSSLNTVANQVIKTIQNGGKVSRNAVTEELQQQKELLFVLSETDKGYAQTQRRVAMLEHILKSVGGSYDYIRQNISDTNKVSDETLRKMYDELQQVNNEGKVTQQVMRGNATAMREIRKEQNRRVESVLGGDLGKQSEASIRNAIANARELIQVYGTSSKRAQTLAAQIVNAESYLKTVGVEAARAAKQQADAVQLAADKYKMMQDRIKNIGSLSQSALTETQKFWQAQKDGATVGSAAYKRAERALNAIAKQQRELTIAMSQQSASKLSRKNLGTLSESELRESINAAKQLAASMKPTDKAYKDLINNIIRAEEHIKSFGLEGQRSAHQAAEQMKVMNDRMLHLNTLSDGALEETRKFWQEQMNGAERGSKAYTEFETKLQEVVNHQKQLSVEQNKQTAATLPNFQNMGEGEIRRAIEAAREYQKTLKIDSDEYRNLSKNIVDAEAYVRKYGVEAKRSAQKDIEAQEKANSERQKAIQLMQDQLQKQGTGLSESALKAQHQYWQRLIDDPKTAASSLQDYKENLKVVENLQNQMMITQGRNALAFFRGDTSNASADQIKQNADALKTYRDSLPRQNEAAIIQEINGYLAQAGKSASGAASQMMSLRDAFRIGLQGGKGSFKGTPEQLRQAKQVLEETLATTDKGSKRFEQLRRALDGIALEEKRVGDVTKEMQTVLDQPKGRSFNELKIAVEEGRKQLNSMSRTTKEAQKAYDELAAKVRAADLELKTLQNTEKGTTSSFEKAVSRLKTYITLYMGTAVAIQKLGTTVSDLMTLSDKMGEVRKTTGFTAEQVGRLSDNLTKLDTRTPVQNLMEISAAAGQLGLTSLEDVQGFTEAANMMLIALPEMGQEAATEMMKIAIATGEVKKIQDQMRQGVIEGSSASAVAMEKIGSTIDRLRATTAAAAPPIADFVKRVGAVGAQSGITVDQVAALGATVNSLGMGTEMAATVVSRMIPALKNHAFDLAQAIGVTPDTIRNLVDGGKSMEAILMILQHIKDQNLNADGIDKLLGIGGMGEIMKELDQRGARAGIVFAGLSQNVDELRKNLITANDAYAEGTAIQDEYNKMNDTTAAKWERLKNQMEEFFVSDANQKFIGRIIDGLRWIVDFITGNLSPAMNAVGEIVKSFAVAWAVAKIGVGHALVSMLKGIYTLDTSIKSCTESVKKFVLANKANIFFAVASALFYLVTAFVNARKEIQKFQEDLAHLDSEEADEEYRLQNLVNAYDNSNKKVREAQKRREELQSQTNALSKEVDALRGSTDRSSDATSKLNAKQTELKKKEQELKKATDDSNRANSERSQLITEINSKYSRYLGYMLNERSAAEQVAAAHMQIVDALRLELEQKRLNKKQEKIDNDTQEKIDKASADVSTSLQSLPSDMQRRVKSQLITIQGRIQRSVDSNGRETYTLPAITGYTNEAVTATSFEGLENALYGVTDKILRKEIHDYEWTRDKNGKSVRRRDKNGNPFKVNPGTHMAAYVDEKGAVISNEKNTYADLLNRVFNSAYSWTSAVVDRERQMDDARLESQAYIRALQANSIADANRANSAAYKSANKILKDAKGKKSLTSNQISDLAQSASVISANFGKYSGLSGSDIYAGKGKASSLEDVINNIYRDLSENQRKQILETANKTQSSINMNEGATNYNSTPYMPTASRNPWGENLDAASTDWGKMNAKELVARRKQMNEFVKALQGDTDVKSVLAEDPALMKAISEKKVSDDADSVIGWYNTQRLKIQDVLHSRFLTNTGSWKDPKNQRSAAKKVKDEMSYYMDELDAYYTERKSKIEEAMSNGEITEAESWKRTLENEQAWRQRRAELQEMYAGKSEKVTADEQQKIYDILSLRTGDSSDMIKKTIGSTYGFIKSVGEKDAAAMHKILGKLDKDIEGDFLKMNKAVSKQVQAMVDIINKERPFNSLTENLQTNLQKMDLLVPELNKKLKEIQDAVEPDKNAEAKMNDEIQQQTYHRTTFLLGEAENAYSMTWDKLEADMRKNGMGSWADAILSSEDADTAKQAIIAQLHSIYDDVQDAIKKETSLMKKQTEIQWSDAILPGNVSMKQTYERTAAALGVEQGRVSRANSMIGAGALSDNVASKLAIKQMQIQLQMQEHYYNLMRKIGEERVADLRRQEQEARLRGDINKADQLALDAKHAQMSLNLTLSEEENALAKQREDIVARTEESQSKIYSMLKDWSTLFASSLQSLFEASNTGLGDYYDSLAKMRLTGEGSAGGTYVVIENSGTENATAHYESLDGEEALKRQLEIEQQNAMADAWNKVMDDINNKISEQITDWINASLQNQALDSNTQALMQNTAALYASINQQPEDFGSDYLVGPDGVPNYLRSPESMDELPRAYREHAGFLNDEQEGNPLPVWPTSEEDLQQKQEQIGSLWTAYKDYGIAAKTEMAEILADVPGANSVLEMTADQQDAQLESVNIAYQDMVDASKDASQQMISNQQAVNKTNTTTSRQMVNTNKNAFAAMTAAANMYGIAYQAMSNDNLTTAQKVEMMIVQAAGQAAISMLTASMAASTGETAANAPGWVSRTLKDLGPIGGPVAVGVFTALIGGLMGLAMSKITKSKSQIAQVTGASAGAGRLSTGMLTYAEGNVNEFTDPSTLTPGRNYNVDGADGRTYRAKYMGANPTTHITNGPEFHLVGERGREAIIDAQTTRQIQMNDTGIWHDIQTLYNGGSISAVRRRRSGVRTFASGNIDEFDDVVVATDGSTSAGGSGSDATAALQASLDRNSEVLERALRDGIKGVFDVYGKGGLVDSYDRGKKQVNRHGEKY